MPFNHSFIFGVAGSLGGEHRVRLKHALALQGHVRRHHARAAHPVRNGGVDDTRIGLPAACTGPAATGLAQLVHLDHVGDELRLAADVDHAAHAGQRDHSDRMPITCQVWRCETTPPT